MSPELEAHLEQLIATGSFTRDELEHCRASAADPRSSGEPPAPQATKLALGVVRTFEESGKYTHYKLIVDGQLLELPDRALFRVVVDGAPYRAYFTGASRLQALEPLAPEEVPDAVADAVRAAGLDPTDPAARRDERVVATVRDQLLGALGRGLDFTMADLAQNRAGRLSPREQGKLRSTASGCFIGAAFFGAIGLVVAASVFHESMVAFAVIAALTALFVVWLASYGVRARRDATAGRVVSGVARFAPRVNHESRTLTIDGATSFQVEQCAFFVRGFDPARVAALSYRVYYAPNESDVMSLEPVDLDAVLSLDPPPG